MNEFRISAYAASNVGKRRQNNEDNYYLNHCNVNSAINTNAMLDNADVFIGSVCDGMGGEAAGEVASQLAVETIEAFEAHLIREGCSDNSINEVINAANDKICGEIRKCKKRMGTTFTLIGIDKDIVTIANIGDSRIYRYSDRSLVQISHDHTEAQTMVDAGIVTMEQSMKLKEKHRLTQHLGIFADEMIIEPYIVRLPIKMNDRYMLCSDGLTDMLSESEIKFIFDKNLSPKDTVQELIAGALEKGGRDNCTVIVCDIENVEKSNVNNISIQNKSNTPAINKNVPQQKNTNAFENDIINAFDIDKKAMANEEIVIKTNNQIKKKSDSNMWKKVSLCLLIALVIVSTICVIEYVKVKKDTLAAKPQTTISQNEKFEKDEKDNMEKDSEPSTNVTEGETTGNNTTEQETTELKITEPKVTEKSTSEAKSSTAKNNFGGTNTF